MARADELTRGRRAALAGLPWWCLAGAVLAHLGLLASGAQAVSAWKRELQLAKPTLTPTALKVRYVAADTDGGEPPAPASPTPRVLASPTAEPLPALAAAPLAAVPPPTGIEPAFYVPRPLLTVGPVARSAVLLAWPDNWPKRGDYRAVLRLYLDERGRVERVEPDGDALLPDPLFDSARQAFLAAEFSPGELNGHPVRAWMRVEVNFESSILPSRP